MRTVESTVAATAATAALEAEAEGLADKEVAAPSLVAAAGGGAAEVEPVTVVTTGMVSVRELSVAVTVSEEPPEEAAPEDAALEIELATLSDETMLDKTELAAVFVEATLDRDETNAELLAELRLVMVVVAAGVVAPGLVVAPVVVLQAESAMPRAAASLQMAVVDQAMLKYDDQGLARGKNE